MGEAQRREAVSMAALAQPLPPDYSIAVLYLDLAFHVLSGQVQQLKLCKVEYANEGLAKALIALSEARTSVLAQANSRIVVAPATDLPSVQ